MGVPGGGQQLGRAVGSITIDVSSVRAAQKEVVAASQNMSRALGAIGVGVNNSAVVNVQVFAATGQSPMDIAGAVRTEVEQLLRQFMGPYQQ